VRPEYFYVYPAVEMGGVEIDFFEIDGADMSFTHGYSDIFLVPMTSELWALPVPMPPMHAPAQERDPRVPRIQPSDSPPWPEPPTRFQ
jgi:hypothetical protein